MVTHSDSTPEVHIPARMRLGDLLIQARLVTEEQVNEALRLQASGGGRLGDNLVAMGAITSDALETFLYRIPAEPATIADTRIDATELLSLLMKTIYVDHLESMRQFVDAIKLPFNIVSDLVQMAVDRQLLYTLGTRLSASPLDMRYVFTEEGRRWTIDALNRMRYSGPAPVTLDEFIHQVNIQKTTNERITYAKIRNSFGDLVVDDRLIEQSGPALAAGKAMLLYGPPGNGKTSVALSFANVFTDLIYVPYAVYVEGQIMRVYDASLHKRPQVEQNGDDHGLPLFLREEYDARWVPCQRPFVVVGGELTLEMLDLQYDATANYYEAPLHIKALGGCFLIDDFGRQLVSPTHLLNRWIVPLENRVDYLKLHTGRTFALPFEAIVIFSTNLEPEDLMDPAFLRRIPYKIEVGGPTKAQYRAIFEQEAARFGMHLPNEIFEAVVYKLTCEKGMDLASYQPRFLVNQVMATCRFMGEEPHFEPRYLDYALDNLRVNRKAVTHAQV